METIKNYLENMFKALPKTEKVLKLKSELLSNMEEKYRELKSEGKTENEAIGIVIAEFGNIDELLSEIDINIPNNESNLPEITLEEADKFISTKKKTSTMVGVGVVLCILGAATLILLYQLLENKIIFPTISGDLQDVLPIITLLIIIAPAVALFIYSGTKLEKYKFIDEGAFFITPATESLLREGHEAHSSSNRIAVIIGVSLCVLSSIAIFIGSAFGDNGSTYGVCVTLLIVAAAVFLFIKFGSISEAYKKLIKIEEFNPAQRKKDKVVGAVAGVVWPLVTCIFLIWGFFYNGWRICWIVFPITGILFGAFASTYSSIKDGDK